MGQRGTAAISLMPELTHHFAFVVKDIFSCRNVFFAAYVAASGGNFLVA